MHLGFFGGRGTLQNEGVLFALLCCPVAKGMQGAMAAWGWSFTACDISMCMGFQGILKENTGGGNELTFQSSELQAVILENACA